MDAQIQTEFKNKYAEKAKTASAHAFDRSFGSRLKYHMEYCINNPGEISKIHRVKAKVDEVKGIMVQNIEKARAMAAPPARVLRRVGNPSSFSGVLAQPTSFQLSSAVAAPHAQLLTWRSWSCKSACAGFCAGANCTGGLFVAGEGHAWQRRLTRADAER